MVACWSSEGGQQDDGEWHPHCDDLHGFHRLTAPTLNSAATTPSNFTSSLTNLCMLLLHATRWIVRRTTDWLKLKAKRIMRFCYDSAVMSKRLPLFRFQFRSLFMIPSNSSSRKPEESQLLPLVLPNKIKQTKF